MEDFITISNPSKKICGTVELPGSKSESNRALIIDALTHKRCNIHNLSTSSDTKILQQALESEETEINVGDAGTAMRFLIAYFAATGQDKILTGNNRMLERPVGPLVDALIELGADISYCNKHGFPPVKINGSLSLFNKKRVKIPGNISSQFISALLMIAPTLPSGLEIEIEGKISSRPYVEMTRQIMFHFGVESKWVENVITIEHQNYNPKDFNIESDWSSASYWYAIAASADDPAIFLKGLQRQSFQGDSVLKEWFTSLGISTEFSDTGAFITKGIEKPSGLPVIIDFTEHPDLAQTFIVYCAANGLKHKFTGLESLRIKETDRILALQNELKKFGVLFTEESPGIFSLISEFDKNTNPFVETYNDHRMAMAFAQLSLYCKEVTIKNPSCTNKSYLSFWNDCKLCGFKIS